MTRSASRPINFLPRNFRQTSGARWNRLASVIRSPVSVLNGSVSRASLMASRISSSHPSRVRGRDRFIVEPASPDSILRPGPKGVLILADLDEQGRLAVLLDVLAEG